MISATILSTMKRCPSLAGDVVDQDIGADRQSAGDTEENAEVDDEKRYGERGYAESRLCYTVAGASLGRRFDDVTGSRMGLGAPQTSYGSAIRVGLDSTESE
jgi:hypothetical protein